MFAPNMPTQRYRVTLKGNGRSNVINADIIFRSTSIEMAIEYAETWLAPLLPQMVVDSVEEIGGV